MSLSSSLVKAPGGSTRAGNLTIAPDIAAEAFRDAVRFLEKEFAGSDDTLSWLKTIKTTSLGDLLDATRQVETKYGESTKHKQGVMSWLRGLSSHILHYGQVLDTLSQHHPEYVSLVWGVMKFILMGVINHGNLVTQFSQALSMIAHVLPITKLSADLYQTDQMRKAVASLYAHVILFLKQALKWYHIGPAGRALTALFKPFELRYKETVDQIRQCARTIDDIASIEAKAEVREINVFTREESARSLEREKKLYEMQARFDLAQADITTAVGKILQIVSCSSTRIEDMHVDLKYIKPRVADSHFRDMLSVMQPRRSADDALQDHKSIVRRMSPWKRRNQNTAWVLQCVGHWISTPESALLVLQAQPRAQAKVKQIATEVIELLRPQSKRLMWYLSNIRAGEGEPTSTSDVLRSLVFQSMTLAPDLVTSSPDKFSIAKLSSYHDETEWMDLLIWLLQRLPECFIVVEAEDLFRSEDQSGTMAATLRGLAQQIDRPGSAVKLLVVSYDRSLSDLGAGRGAQRQVVDIWKETPKPRRMRYSGPRSTFPGATPGRIGRRVRPGLSH